MRAAVFHAPNQPLELTEIPTPTPGAGEVLVRVAACGMCHTDLHYLDHGVKTFKKPPLVLGHEVAGTVAELGAGVGDHSPDDRVLIPSVLSCGRCRYCRNGRENLCECLVMLGNNIDGGYAEYVVVPADELVPVPESIPLERACVIADALSTPYHAVKDRGRVRPGDTVAVVGCGGVGLNVVQCAAAAGARVVALDLVDARLELARELGALETLNPTSVERPDKQIRKLTDGGVDVAFEVVGSPSTIQLAFSLLRKGGRLCIVGFSAESVSLPAGKIMYYEQEVVGSLGCGGGAYPEIMRMVEAGQLRLEPIVSGSFPLEEINEAFNRLRRGEGVRWVVTP
jgi:6-hydroxycyclohex-1-ene-1-carbonyl-CoA dehydrogenase